MNAAAAFSLDSFLLFLLNRLYEPSIIYSVVQEPSQVYNHMLPQCTLNTQRPIRLMYYVQMDNQSNQNLLTASAESFLTEGTGKLNVSCQTQREHELITSCSNCCKERKALLLCILMICHSSRQHCYISHANANKYLGNLVIHLKGAILFLLVSKFILTSIDTN